MTRQARCATLLAAVIALVTACAPLIGTDPRYATDRNRDSVETPAPEAPAGPPPIAGPADNLGWVECTSELFAAAGVPAPDGVILECADYDADLDPIDGATGSLEIGVVQARSEQTPDDAGPIVFTTGSDVPSSRQLPVWLTQAGSEILQTNPIVAVDRRGMGRSSPVECRDPYDREAMQDQAQFEPGDDPVAALGEITLTATTNCTDTIAPGDSAYDNAHAAEDLERLRSKFDVPTLALAGVGNGSQIAMAYAGLHPDKVSRLILDSPVPLGVSAEAATEQRVKGQQAALDSFAGQCAAAGCALGPDPKAAVDELLSAAAAGRGPGGASVSALVNAITTALAFPQGDRDAATLALADTLAAARSGDIGPLMDLIGRSEDERLTDGQFINRCSDALNRPTPNRARELVVAWPKLYPQFGAVGALDMVKCLHWPSGSVPDEPKDLGIDVLLLGGANDPIVGSEGVAATAAAMINAGATSKRVMWQGIGHGASIYSPCAMAPLLTYIKSGAAPSTDTYCPA